MNNKYKHILTKDYLYKEYVINKKSSIKISDNIGCNKTTVLNKLKKFNIKRRTNKEALIGKKQSIKSRIKRSLKMKKNPVKYWLGKKHNKKHRNNVSRALKGRIKTEEHIRNQAISLSKRKGGITPIHNLIRNLKNTDIWRESIFKRDNYTCQECYIRGVYIEAHHIKQFSKILSEFLKEYDQFSPVEDKETLLRLATKYKPFWNTNNGITLCKDCHNKTKGNNHATI